MESNVLEDDHHDADGRVALWSQAMASTTLSLRGSPAHGGGPRHEGAVVTGAADEAPMGGKPSQYKKKKRNKKGKKKAKALLPETGMMASPELPTPPTDEALLKGITNETGFDKLPMDGEAAVEAAATVAAAAAAKDSHNICSASEAVSVTSAMTEYKLVDRHASSSQGRGEGEAVLDSSLSLWSSVKMATTSPSSSPSPRPCVSPSDPRPKPFRWELVVPESTPQRRHGALDDKEAVQHTGNDVEIDDDKKCSYENDDNDDEVDEDEDDEASDIKSTSLSHRSLCTGMSVTVASSGIDDNSYDEGEELVKEEVEKSLSPPVSTEEGGRPNDTIDRDFGVWSEEPQQSPAPPALVGTTSASSFSARDDGARVGGQETTPTCAYGEEDGPSTSPHHHHQHYRRSPAGNGNRRVSASAATNDIVVHPEELMPPELHRPAPGPTNLVAGSREELEDAVAAAAAALSSCPPGDDAAASPTPRKNDGGEATREIVFEPPEEARVKEDEVGQNEPGMDRASEHSSPSAMRNYFLDRMPSPLSPRGQIREGDGLLDTNSEGEQVPVASMNETWCKGLPLSAALLPPDDDDNDDGSDDAQSEISDLSDDRSNAFVGLDSALASAKQVYGFNGEPASPKAGKKPAIAATPLVPPTPSGGARGEATYEPSVPTFTQTRPTPRSSKGGRVLRKAASLRALPIPTEPRGDAAQTPTDPTFEPAIPSFHGPSRPPGRHPHAGALRPLRSQSHRSVYSTASQQTVEIHLDIYVSPIMEDSPALEGLPDRPYVPAALTNSHPQQQPPNRGKNRFRRWTSFRSGRSSSSRELQARRRGKKNAALRLPMLSIPTDDDSNASSQESHLDDIDELEDHLQIEYATEENVLNTGYEKRDDLYEKDFLTCPLDDVYARFEGRKAKPESPKDSLTEVQRTCCAHLKSRWAEKYPKLPLSDEMILRFALCAPRGMFHEASAWKKMRRFDRRYLTLTAAGMEKQLRTKTLFPLPGVETKEGNACFYMRPSRYFPKETSVTEIIDNQCYVMSTLMEVEKNARNGIGFIANMDNWQFVNFEVKYCFCFMMALQNCAVPTKVTHFLIVNPPSWFGKIWAIMKTMLAPSFQKKVKMIPERYLHLYLKPGYEEYLPDEMESGLADMEDIVLEFLEERKRIERGAASSPPIMVAGPS